MIHIISMIISVIILIILLFRDLLSMCSFILKSFIRKTLSMLAVVSQCVCVCVCVCVRVRVDRESESERLCSLRFVREIVIFFFFECVSVLLMMTYSNDLPLNKNSTK